MSDRANTFLLFGSTGSGKTAQLGEMAKWLHAKTGEISRLISADSGWDPISDLVISPENPGGIVEAWNIQGLQDPWTVLIELSEGSWPEVTEAKGLDGKYARKLKMIRPNWSEGARKRVIAADGRPVGQYFIEGLTTLAMLCLQDHQRTARKLSQDVVGTFSSTITASEGGKDIQKTLSFSAAAPSHYGQVQRFLLYDLVPRFGRLAATQVVWTAHESRGKDDITQIDKSILGPATCGTATVDKTVQCFGHSLHMTSDTDTDAKGNIKQDFRAWFVKHPDPILTKMKWETKTSLTMPQLAELLKEFPGGFISLSGGKSIGQFLDFLARI